MAGRRYGLRRGARWARRRWRLWLTTATSVNLGLIALISVLIQVADDSATMVTALLLALLLSLATSVAFPVAGHVLELRDQRADDDARSGRLLAVGTLGRLPRLSGLSDVQLGATATRYSDRGRYVSRGEHDGKVGELLAQQGPPYPFVVVWGTTKSGKSRTTVEAARRAFTHDPIVLLPRDGGALAELVRLGTYAAAEADAPSAVWLDDLTPADLNVLTTSVLDEVLRHCVVVATMSARRRSEVLKSGGEVGMVARAALHQAREYELPFHITDAEKVEAEQAYPAEDFRGSIAETLVGGRELLARYRASADEHPAGCAVVRAAIDCRRAGLSWPITDDVLRLLFDLHLPTIRSDLDPTRERFDAGIEWATKPVASQVALLSRVKGDPLTYTVLDHVVTADDGDDDHQPRLVPPWLWRTLIDLAGPLEMFDLGWAAHHRQATDAALEAFEMAQTFDIFRAPMAAFNLGILRNGRGDLDGACAAYRQAVDYGWPDVAPQAACNLGDVLERKGDTEAARDAYRQAMDSDHPDAAPRAAGRLGSMLKEQGDTEAARDAYQQAMDSDHPDAAPRAAINLGKLLVLQGDDEAAHNAYQKAIESGHRDCAPAAELGLGAVLVKRGDYDGARGACERALESGDPETARSATTNLVQVLKQQGDMDAVRATCERALESSRGDPSPEAALWIGFLHSELGDRDAARHAWQRAMDSGDPMAAPPAMFNLGKFLNEEGDPDGARELFRRTIETDHPEAAPMAAYGLGCLLMRQGDTQAARDAFQRTAQSASLAELGRRALDYLD